MTEAQPGRRPPLPILVLLLGCTALAGCEVSRAAVGPSGRLDVLAPSPGFAGTREIDQWKMVAADEEHGPRYATHDHEGVQSLRVTSGTETGILFRHTDAILPVTPYLSWAWNVEPHGGTEHPVRIIVGFHGGDPESGSWGSQPLKWIGSDLPPYDRLLTIGWDASALRRGNLTPPRENPRAPRHYTVRGGRENTGDWRLETVDLTRLYGLAWPSDDTASVRVMFIGIAALGSATPATMNISGLVLSR
jgi:hypothetical protein